MRADQITQLGANGGRSGSRLALQVLPVGGTMQQAGKSNRFRQSRNRSIVGRWDVLLGRGKSHMQNPGNVRFQRIIMDFFDEYFGSKSVVEKTSLSRRIVDLVEERGKFLKLEPCGGWTEVTDPNEKRHKVNHALQYRRRQKLRDGSYHDTSSKAVEKDADISGDQSTASASIVEDMLAPEDIELLKGYTNRVVTDEDSVFTGNEDSVFTSNDESVFTCNEDSVFTCNETDRSEAVETTDSDSARVVTDEDSVRWGNGCEPLGVSPWQCTVDIRAIPTDSDEPLHQESNRRSTSSSNSSKGMKQEPHHDFGAIMDTVMGGDLPRDDSLGSLLHSYDDPPPPVEDDYLLLQGEDSFIGSVFSSMAHDFSSC